MTTEKFRNSLSCEIDFTITVIDLFPVKTDESFAFDRNLYIADSDLKEKLCCHDIKAVDNFCNPQKQICD